MRAIGLSQVDVQSHVYWQPLSGVYMQLLEWAVLRLKLLRVRPSGAARSELVRRDGMGQQHDQTSCRGFNWMESKCPSDCGHATVDFVRALESIQTIQRTCCGHGKGQSTASCAEQTNHHDCMWSWCQTGSNRGGHGGACSVPMDQDCSAQQLGRHRSVCSSCRGQ